MLDSGALGPTKLTGPPKEPKGILIEAANFFWSRSVWLYDHAKRLADLEADRASIEAIMASA